MENKGHGEKRTAGVTKKRAKDQEECEGRREWERQRDKVGGREREREKKAVSVITEHD